MRLARRKRAFTVLEVLLAISILSIGLVSVVSLFPVAIYAHRQMIDKTRSAFIERQAMDIMRANRVADYLAAGGGAVPVEYPGDSEAPVPSLYENMVSAGWTVVFRDIDGNYPNLAPAGWRYVWTMWDDLGRTAANVVPPRPDATRPDAAAVAVPERVFSDYSWTANIYQQNTIASGAGSIYRYRTQIAVFRGFDGMPEVDVSAGASVAGNDPANGKGYIEANASDLADALTIAHGYLRVSRAAPPGVDAQNQLWYRVESVHRNVGPARDRTRFVLSEAFRGPVTSVPFFPTTMQTSTNIVHLGESVLVGQQ